MPPFQRTLSNCVCMKISVVIASYNGAPYISEQLRSICTQTLPPHEIIVSDDGSTDNTRDIVHKFAKEFDFIDVRFVDNPSPHGVDRNFENALRHVSGDVVFICDQDDVWLPERIEVMSQAFCGSSPTATFCDSRVVDENLKDLGYTHIQSRGFCSFDEIFVPHSTAFLKRVPPAGHDMAFSSEFIDVLLPFPDLKDCYDTWIGMVLFALRAWKFSASVPLTLFRRHSRSVTRSGLVPTLKESLAQAAKAVEDDAAAWHGKLYSELIARLGDKIDEEMLSLLEARRRHSIARTQMNTSFFRKMRLIWQETVNGNYFRFGRSFQNIVQDILFRRSNR